MAEQALETPELARFRALFPEGFARPNLYTAKFSDAWADGEFICDVLAGPLYSIYTTGTCDYVFLYKELFPGIDTADDFRRWCLDAVREYRAVTLKEEPQDEQEKTDKEVLQRKTEVMEELSELAYAIVKATRGK